MNRIELIQSLLPLLFVWGDEVKTPRRATASQIKLQLRRLTEFYFKEGEVIKACVDLGMRKVECMGPRYAWIEFDRLNTKFDTNFIDAPHLYTQRPRGYNKAKWDNFLFAQKRCKEIIDELIKDDNSEDSRFVKLAKAVGYPPNEE